MTLQNPFLGFLRFKKLGYEKAMYLPTFLIDVIKYGVSFDGFPK